MSVILIEGIRSFLWQQSRLTVARITFLTQKTVYICTYGLSWTASGVFVARVGVHSLPKLVGYFSFVGPTVFISHFLNWLQICWEVVIKLRNLLRFSNCTQLSTFNPHAKVWLSARSITRMRHQLLSWRIILAFTSWLKWNITILLAIGSKPARNSKTMHPLINSGCLLSKLILL